MASYILGRRAFLALGAGLALAGCATSFTDLSKIPVVRAVNVSGGGNLWLETMPAYVQRNLISQLGSRYQPGARGGAVLSVRLTDIDFPTDSDGGIISIDSVDTLDGRITLTSSSGAVLKSFPLLATTNSVDAMAEVPMPTTRRYNWLASSYAHWVLSKLT